MRHPEQVRKKVETGAGHLIGERNDLVPYLGSLYSLSYPEIEEVSPEYWKTRLHEAVQMILSSLARRSRGHLPGGSTLGDPSSIELIRLILNDLRLPALFLCAYRPPSISSPPISLPAWVRHTRKLDFMIFLLRSPDHGGIAPQGGSYSIGTPAFHPDEGGGNPFYLEEVINALIESETLIKDNDNGSSQIYSGSEHPFHSPRVIAARLMVWNGI